ncbi:MAG: LCP family protein [Suipraeoptans sp.]
MSSNSKYHRGRRHTGNHATRVEKSQGSDVGRFIGRVVSIIQLMVSAAFVLVLWNSGLLPSKYLIAVAAVLVVLFIVTFVLQFPKNRAFIVGIVISVIISITLGLGLYYLSTTNSMLEEISGAKYKTDNMVVVVLNDDPAQSLDDAKDYVFGTQTAMDTENTKVMTDEVEKELGQSIQVKEYSSMTELAQAILSGDVNAGIYNESLESIAADTVEEYYGATRVIYQHGIESEMEEEQTGDISKSFSVFISGIDVSGPISTNSRSDVNIIMTVNPDTKKILLTTTPRDYYVEIPGVSGGAKDKLTHAGIYGVDASMRTLSNLYGIDIDYYARVNFDSVVKIVDAVGGVTVDSEEAFTTTVGNFTINQGSNTLNGNQALAFCRERYNVSGGDNQRGKNQQKVITAILQKMMSPALLTSFNSIVSGVEGSVQTNMTHDEMQQLVSGQLATGVNYDIQSVAAEGTGGSDVCFSTGSQALYVTYPDDASIAGIKEAMNNVINGQ